MATVLSRRRGGVRGPGLRTAAFHIGVFAISDPSVFPARRRRVWYRSGGRCECDYAGDAAVVLTICTIHRRAGGRCGCAGSGAAGGKSGRRVLVDEVYLELMFRDGNAFTSFHEDGNIIVTAALQGYGLSGCAADGY